MPSQVLVITALITVQILFGINYIVSKVIVGVFPPLIWASIRLFIAGIALAAIATLSRRKHPPLTLDFFKPMILYAFLGITINQGAFLTGLHYTTATNSAILNTLIPIFTLLFVTLSGKEPLTLKRTLGFFSACSGVLALQKIENFSFGNETFLGDALIILNCLSLALFFTTSKKFIETHDHLWTTTWLFILGWFGVTILAIPYWHSFQWPEMTRKLEYCMVFAILGSSLLTYLLNLWALRRAQSSSVALFIYLQPVVASLLAWIYFGETITTRTAISSLLIFAGMLLGLSSPAKASMAKTSMSDRVEEA